jgi:hypothetical protein
VEQLFKFGRPYLNLTSFDIVTDPGFIGSVFPLIRRVFSRTLASEIVSVQPLAAPLGIFFYNDYIYDIKNKFTFGRTWKP